MVGLVHDDVDHVVNGDTTDQDALVINHRRRYQVAPFENFRDFGIRHGGRNRFHVGDHRFTHGGAAVEHQHPGQRQDADKLVLAVDHQQVISGVRNITAKPQEALHYPEGNFRAHGDHVGVHQATGGILRIAQYRLQAFAILFVERFQHLLGDLLGQFLQQVGEVVELQVLDQHQQFIRRQFLEELATNLLAEILQDFGALLAVEQLPENFPFARW